MAARVDLREITPEEGNRLLRVVRRGTGSVGHRGGRPPTFTLPKRQEIKRIALTDPTGQPFATWSLAKPADYLVAEGMVADIHEGLRQLLREEDVRPAQPPAPSRRQGLGAARQAEAHPCHLQAPGCVTRCPATTSAATGCTATSKSARAGSSSWSSAATSARSIRRRSASTLCSTTSAHKDEQVRDWAHDNNVELAYTPHYASWLNRIEAQFKALRYFALNGTDHPDHATQARLIRPLHRLRRVYIAYAASSESRSSGSAPRRRRSSARGPAAGPDGRPPRAVLSRGRRGTRWSAAACSILRFRRRAPAGWPLRAVSPRSS
jgi:DDE superfamily endonuclease